MDREEGHYIKFECSHECVYGVTVVILPRRVRTRTKQNHKSLRLLRL